MKKSGKTVLLSVLLPVILLVVIAGSMVSSLKNIDNDVAVEDRQNLEDSVRRAAVACYAAEGFYPPDLAYITEHYGVVSDEERYTVVYEVFAKNIMPDITVLDKKAELKE